MSILPVLDQHMTLVSVTDIILPADNWLKQ